jgi:hypothetical protein
MVQTKTLTWLMTIALASVTFYFVAQVLEPAEFQKMFEDSSLFVSRSILISGFFIFIYYTSKLLYKLFIFKKPTENIFIGTLFLLFLILSLKTILTGIFFQFDFFYCYNLDFGNCIEGIILLLLNLFALCLLLLSSFFYLGALQVNKKLTFLLPTKEKTAKMQIYFGCFLFLGTLLWSLFILPSLDYNVSVAFTDYINDITEAVRTENLNNVNIQNELTQGMIRYTFDTILHTTKYVSSILSILLFSISLIFIFQGLYNLKDKSK